MGRHVHGGLLFAAAVISVVVLFNFVVRGAAMRFPDNAPIQGLAVAAGLAPAA